MACLCSTRFACSLIALVCAGITTCPATTNASGWAEIMPRASRSPVLSATRIAEGAMIAVGERGHILQSTDNGVEWNQVPSPTRATLTGLFSRQHTIIAVGHQGTVLRRTSSEGSWERLETGLSIEENLLGVHSPSQGVWWALGAYGLFLESQDDGATWTRRTLSEEDLHLHAVIAVSDTHFLVVGEQGLLLETLDSGTTWEERDSPYDGSLFGGCVLDSGEVLLYGLRGHVFVGDLESGDWTALTTPVTTLIAAHAVMPDGHVVLGAAGGYFLMAKPGEWRWKVWHDEHMPLTSHMLALDADSVLVSGGRGAQRLTLIHKP